jgi:hypothetical protein
VGNLASVRLFAVVGDVSRERVAWWKPNLTRICETGWARTGGCSAWTQIRLDRVRLICLPNTSSMTKELH